MLTSSLATYNRSQAGFLSDGIKDTDLLDSEGGFEVFLPLSLLFDSAACGELIYFSRLELTLQRAATSKDAVLRRNKTTTTGGLTSIVASAEEVECTLSSIDLHLEHITFTTEYQSSVMRAISSNSLQNFNFDKLNMYVAPIQKTDKCIIQVKTYSAKLIPKFVVVGFSLYKQQDFGKDANLLDAANAISAFAFVNSMIFPQQTWFISQTDKRLGHLYEEYKALHKAANADSAPNAGDACVLGKKKFESQFCVFCIRINSHVVNTLTQAVDLTVEVAADSRLFPESNCVIGVIAEENYTFSILNHQLLQTL
jgi:hypothetical protein